MAPADVQQTILSESRDEILQRHRTTRDEVLSESDSQLYIGGEWVQGASGETFETRDPTTQEVVGTAQAGNAEDVDRAVEAAREAYRSSFSGAAPSDRQSLLNDLADCLEANMDPLAKLVTLENGKPINEARFGVLGAADHLRYFAGLARNVTGETLQSGPSNHVEVVREPYGVVGQIIPWNFPILMAAWKLGPALAAGNCIVLKPAEQTPLSILEFVRRAEDVLPDGVLNVVTGFGADAGAPISRHPGIRKVAFTGSVETGRKVMNGAAENITDITLELGGKSPVVVYPDADLGTAVQTVIMAIFMNTGENCTAGSRLFLHEAIREEFLEAFAEAASGMTVGDPLLEETQIGPKVTEAQLDRTLEYLEYAEESGGEFVLGGHRLDDGGLSEGNFVLPTVITGLDNRNRCAQEEIFGPVEVVMEWSDYDEMIREANDVDYGLAAGVITEDLDQAHRTARDLEAGTVWVNTYNEIPAGQPFGGYKQSGIGRECSEETLYHYTRTKTIHVGNID